MEDWSCLHHTSRLVVSKSLSWRRTRQYQTSHSCITPFNLDLFNGNNFVSCFLQYSLHCVFFPTFPNHSLLLYVHAISLSSTLCALTFLPSSNYARHSHHNETNTPAWVLPIQDAGLYTHQRTLDICFSVAPPEKV